MKPKNSTLRVFNCDHPGGTRVAVAKTRGFYLRHHDVTRLFPHVFLNGNVLQRITFSCFACGRVIPVDEVHGVKTVAAGDRLRIMCAGFCPACHGFTLYSHGFDNELHDFTIDGERWRPARDATIKMRDSLMWRVYYTPLVLFRRLWYGLLTG